MALFSGQGVTPSLKGTTTNVVTLQAGQVQTLSPAGWYWVKTGLYTTLSLVFGVLSALVTTPQSITSFTRMASTIVSPTRPVQLSALC